MHSTKLFSVNKANRTFASEISSLGGKFEIIDNELGLTLVSERTGRKSEWVIAQMLRNAEGDITHWELIPTAKTLHNNVGLRSWRMTIFND